MCEPRVSWGIADLLALALLSKGGRCILAIAGTGGALYMAAHIKVHVPLLLPVGLAAWAMLATLTALLMRQRARTLSAVYTTAREQRPTVTAVDARQPGAIEAPRPDLTTVVTGAAVREAP